jgi:hypothetical protein
MAPVPESCERLAPSSRPTRSGETFHPAAVRLMMSSGCSSAMREIS